MASMDWLLKKIDLIDMTEH